MIFRKAVAFPDDQFGRLMAECDRDLKQILARLKESGNIGQWQDEMRELLETYHKRAHLLGQAKWGMSSDTLATARMVRAVRLGVSGEPELAFLENFAYALRDKDERYFDEDGLMRDDRVLARMQMYEGRMRGSESWGTLDGGPPATLWKWVLGRVEDHCADCPWNASLTPVTADEWYTVPGDCATPCLWNCKCHLEAVNLGVSTAHAI